MASTPESTFEEFKLGWEDHPYMCLYEPLLDPTKIYEESDDDSTESSPDENLKEGFIRTSPLQKYPVKYETRIYSVQSAECLTNKEQLRPSPPKVTFTKNLPRIFPSRKRERPKKSPGTPTSSKKKTRVQKQVSPSTRIATESPTRSSPRRCKKVDTSEHMKREKSAKQEKSDTTAKKGSPPTDVAEGKNSPSSSSGSAEDNMRRYPKRKRVSCEIFVPQSKLRDRDEEKKRNDEKKKRQKSILNETKKANDESEDKSVKSESSYNYDPRKKKSRKQYRPKYNVDYDELAKEKSKEDYSKDVVTDLSDSRDKIWNARFRELLAYYREHGHTKFLKNETRPKLKSLSEFCVTQRRVWKMKRMHPNRFRRLNSIDFKFAPLDSRPQWDDQFQKLVEYKKKHGNPNVPKRDESLLYYWCRKQRTHYHNYAGKAKPYPKYRRDKLESIGFLWYGWRTFPMRCSELKAFHDKHGHFRIPSDHPNYLAKWLQFREEEYARGKLPKKYEQMLKDIGIDVAKRKRQRESAKKSNKAKK